MTSQFEGEISWPDIQAHWQLEPELHQKTPRRIAPRGEKVGCGGRTFGCFLGGMMSFMFLVGLLMSVWAGLALLILPFGSTTQGTVTRHETTLSSGRRKGTQSYFLHFAFAKNSKSYSGEWPVSRRVFGEIPDGGAVAVRYFPFAPGLRPMIKEGASPWFHIWALGPLGLLMLGVSGAVLLAMWAPRSGKRLVRRGVATPAIVVSRSESEDAGGPSITYLFRAGDRTFEKTHRFNNDFWTQTTVGQILTVLHHPRRPSRALIYRFCDFRAQ